MGLLYGPGSCLPQYKSCCFCCSLRTGVGIIGWIFLISFTLMLPLSIKLIIDTVEGHLVSEQHVAVTIWLTEALILQIVGVIVSVMLLLGRSQDNPRYMVPFIFLMYFTIIQAILEVIMYFFVGQTSITFSLMNKQYTRKIFGDWYTPVPAVLVALYFASVVNSYYNQLCDGTLMVHY